VDTCWKLRGEELALSDDDFSVKGFAAISR
jgi:hypothetical protein